MPCIFCLAVFAMFAGAITTAVLDGMESRLASVSREPVRRVVDSASVTRFDTTVASPSGGPVPVSVTVYKQHKRVRIQVLTHDLTRAEAEAVEDMLARVLELRIVDRSDAHDEEKVRDAFGDETAETEDAETVQTQQTARATEQQQRPQ